MNWGLGKKILSLIIVCFVFVLSVNAQTTSYTGNETRNYALQNSFAEYMHSVKGKIYRTWLPPDFLEHAHALMMFRINRDGSLENIQIVESSGNQVFDESAVEALKKCQPFDKFPENSSREYITIKYAFDTSYVKTDKMKKYVENAERYYNVDNKLALENINLAIEEVNGDIGSYFLYGRRSKIKKALGDYAGAEADVIEAKRLKEKFDIRRIGITKRIAEEEKTPFAYFNLAFAYDIAGDYKNAINAIDKAISLTNLNNEYKRYRSDLLTKLENSI